MRRCHRIQAIVGIREDDRKRAETVRNDLRMHNLMKFISLKLDGMETIRVADSN